MQSSFHAQYPSVSSSASMKELDFIFGLVDQPDNSCAPHLTFDNVNQQHEVTSLSLNYSIFFVVV